MARIFMVRHGDASAAWHEADDPGLSDLGCRQAEAVAEELAEYGPLQLFTSPLARARETATPLSKLWSRTPIVTPSVSEVPAPPDRKHDRRDWLTELAQARWADTGDAVRVWRDDVLSFLLCCKQDCVVFSHFVAINAAIGASAGKEQVFCFRPANCSVSILETDGANLSLVSRGSEAATVVN